MTENIVKLMLKKSVQYFVLKPNQNIKTSTKGKIN